MYYSEITKIIEAGLDRDKEKVISFAKLLAKKLEADGESRGSERISAILERKSNGRALTDSLVPLPVDQESRLNIVDVDYSPETIDFVLAPAVEAKLQDFMMTIQNKSRMEEVGLDFNMSLLLYGYPGCGKTSAAKYIAAKMGLPLVVARLDTLISSLLGSTAKNIHKIFDFAQKQPCVLFLDEFDAIAKARDDQHELGELKRVVNSLLQNIDDFSQEGILIAATNHADMLDTAVWRRFQIRLFLPTPTKKQISEWFINFEKKSNIHLKMNTELLSEKLFGLSFSEINEFGATLLRKYVLSLPEADMKDIIEHTLENWKTYSVCVQ